MLQLSRRFLSNTPKNFYHFPYKYHEEVRAVVKEISLETGHGVAVDVDHPERCVVVPKVWVGEEVLVRVFRNKTEERGRGRRRRRRSVVDREENDQSVSYSDADLIEVLKPSPHRILAPCSYFDKSCSGCQFQHIRVSVQQEWKKEQVLRVLKEANCNLSEAVVSDVRGNDKNRLYFYRSKITPQVDYKPRKSTEINEFARGIPRIGFSKDNSREVMDIQSCILATGRVNDEYKKVRREIISETIHNNKMKEEEEEEEEENDDKVSKKKRKKWMSSLLFRDDRKSSVITDPNDFITEDVHGLSFRYRAGEFFQVNPFILPSLVSYVVSEAAGDGSKYLIDAYCGSGLFSLCGAVKFTSVVGIEVSQRAVQAAHQNAMNNKIDNVKFVEGKVESLFDEVKTMSGIVPEETAVIIDPSRSGCDKLFLNQLIEFAPQRIVYVSCNPSTQARDAAILTGHGYAISRVTIYDMFPQTKHIENVLTFRKVMKS